jgi:cytochrome c-550 PedF
MALQHRKAAVAALLATALASPVLAHGDVSTQPVDTSALPQLDGEWMSENPYRDTEAYEAAIEIGEKAYNQNCARCHGLDAVSGGIAPDLRYLYVPDDDEYYIGRYQDGVVRNGMTYMPAFGETLGQEAGWAIRSWLDTVAEP